MKYLSRFFELREQRSDHLLGAAVRRGRVDHAAAELGKDSQRVAKRRHLFRRGILIDDRRSDADDGQLLAASTESAAGSALRLVNPSAFEREGRQAVEREQRAGADAELECIATGEQRGRRVIVGAWVRMTAVGARM